MNNLENKKLDLIGDFITKYKNEALTTSKDIEVKVC